MCGCQEFVMLPIREEFTHIFLLEEMLQRRVYKACTKLRIACL